jgi:tRNA dimethylallyltransferase
MGTPTTVLIAGPTASGKSHLALDLAARHGGLVVNADSMQVYAELRVLTARPSPADEAAVAHRLYGHVPAATRYSVGRWLGDVAAVLAEARGQGRRAIIVGGTGLYFRALTEGLAAVPAIPAEVRVALRDESEGAETPALHARLASLDPEDAATIRTSDRSRIVRALEVFTATGRSLAGWRRVAAAPPLVDPATAERMVLAPDRAVLHRRIAARAAKMLEEGALAEVAALLSLGLDKELPAMKAIGVRELTAHMAGNLSREEALASIATETRHYAKRQMTWFRNQMADWPQVAAASPLDLAAAGT